MCDFDFLLFNNENNQENIQFNLNGLNDHLSFDNNKNIVLNLIKKENLDFFIFKSSLYNLDNFYDVDNYASINDLSNHITNKCSISYIYVNNEKEISFINKKMPAHSIVFIGIFDGDIINLINFKLTEKFDILLHNIKEKKYIIYNFLEENKNNKVILLNEITQNPVILNILYSNIISEKYSNIISENSILISINQIFIDSINQWKEKTYIKKSKNKLINIISYILFKSEKFVISKNKNIKNRFIISFEELIGLLISFDYDLNFKNLEDFLNEFNYIFNNYNNEDEYYYVKNSFFISLFCYDYLIYKHNDNLDNIIQELFIGNYLLSNSDQILNIINVFNNKFKLIDKKFTLKLRVDFFIHLLLNNQIFKVEIQPEEDLILYLKKEKEEFLKTIKNIYDNNKHIRLISENKNILNIINKEQLNEEDIIILLNILIKVDSYNDFNKKISNKYVIIELPIQYLTDKNIVQSENHISYSLNFNNFSNNFINSFKNNSINSISDIIFNKLFLKPELINFNSGYDLDIYHYINIFDNLKNKIFDLSDILDEDKKQKYYLSSSNFEVFLKIFDSINEKECDTEFFIKNNFKYIEGKKGNPQDENHINKNISNLLKYKYGISIANEVEHNDNTRTDITIFGFKNSRIAIECKGQWNHDLEIKNEEYPCVSQLINYLKNEKIKNGLLLIYTFPNKYCINKDKHGNKDFSELKKYIEHVNITEEINIKFKELEFKIDIIGSEKLKNIYQYIIKDNSFFSKTTIQDIVSIKYNLAEDIINMLKKNNLTNYDKSTKKYKLKDDHNLEESKFIKLYNEYINDKI